MAHLKGRIDRNIACAASAGDQILHLSKDLFSEDAIVLKDLPGLLSVDG